MRDDVVVSGAGGAALEHVLMWGGSGGRDGTQGDA